MLGLQVDAFGDASGAANVPGWNEGDRDKLKATIAARRPFLDFVYHRVNPDGTRQQFRVSGEPMFNQTGRFRGYRGIGVEISTSH